MKKLFYIPEFLFVFNSLQKLHIGYNGYFPFIIFLDKTGSFFIS